MKLSIQNYVWLAAECKRAPNVICHCQGAVVSASTATSPGCFIAFIEPVVGIPLCNLDNMYHGGIFEFWRLNYIQKRHWGVVIQRCEITCGYAATWSSSHLCVARPCCPHRGFHSCEKILKIFATIKVISKRVIPKFQLLRARFELEKYIFWRNQHKNAVISGFTPESALLYTISHWKGKRLSRLRMFESRRWWCTQ